MPSLIETLLTNLALIATLMVLAWLVSLVKQDASIIDSMWGVGFVAIAWLSCWLNRPPEFRPTMLAVLTTVWGARLSLFLLWRNWGHAEDRRYSAMRDYHQQRFWWVSLFTVFLLQSIFLWFVALPIQVAVSRDQPSPLNWLDVLGILILAVGLTFEATGDWQLARFKANPANANRVMDRGLWQFTRHPNYFGDFCVWWGLYLIAAAGGAWWTILSPAAMSFLLLKVSGVPLLERNIAERRPDYDAYQNRTNAFFPGPRR